MMKNKEMNAKVVYLKASQLNNFKRNVFGSEDILQNYPELLRDGVAVVLFGKFWHIFDKETRKMDKDNFFNEEEMTYLSIESEKTLSEKQ